MRIAIINETSAADRNGDILAALDGRGHEIINAGMNKAGGKPELTYIHTGLLAALLLNTGRADLIVGGCGTGIGFMNSALQYPAVICGHVMKPLDAWLFAQINGGNCISLQLLYEYGWAGDANLRFIIDALFSVESGGGYPAHRRESQRESRDLLKGVSRATHRSMAEIVSSLEDRVIKPVLDYPGVMDILDLKSMRDRELREAIDKRK